MNLATQFPKNWQTHYLGEIISDLRGGAPLEPEDFVDKGFPVLHKGAIKPFGFIEIDKKKKTFTHDSFVKKHLNSVVTQKYVAVTLRDLVPSGPSIGLMAYLKSRSFREYLLAQGSYAFLVDETKVCPQYLVYLSNTVPYRKYIRSIAVGSTQIHVRTPEFKEILVPIPSLDEQKRIAAILDKADRLRRQRRFAQTLSDSFLQSVFIKMFGDTFKNEKGFEVGDLGQRISFMTSGSRGWAEHYTAKGDLFLRIQNVNKGELLLNDVAYVQAPDSAEARRTKVREGDVLITMTADLGRSAVIPKNLPTAYINQHIGLLRVKNINPTFLSHFITSRSGHIQIQMLDHEGVKSGLNFDDIKGIRVLLPPLPLQEKFAAIVHKFERVRRQQREATRQAEHLFQTLLHRAFRGEL